MPSYKEIFDLRPAEHEDYGVYKEDDLVEAMAKRLWLLGVWIKERAYKELSVFLGTAIAESFQGLATSKGPVKEYTDLIENFEELDKQDPDRMRSICGTTQVWLSKRANKEAKNFQKKISSLLGIEILYNQFYDCSSSDEKKKKNSSGGFVLRIFVEKKGNMLETLQVQCGNKKFETYKHGDLTTRSKNPADVARRAAARKNGRKKPKCPPVMLTRQVSSQTHGFNGWIHYHKGHPLLRQGNGGYLLLGESVPTPIGAKTAGNGAANKKTDFLLWLSRKLEEDSFETHFQFIEVVAAKFGMPEGWLRLPAATESGDMYEWLMDACTKRIFQDETDLVRQVQRAFDGRIDHQALLMESSFDLNAGEDREEIVAGQGLLGLGHNDDTFDKRDYRWVSVVWFAVSLALLYSGSYSFDMHYCLVQADDPKLLAPRIPVPPALGAETEHPVRNSLGLQPTPNNGRRGEITDSESESTPSDQTSGSGGGGAAAACTRNATEETGQEEEDVHFEGITFQTPSKGVGTPAKTPEENAEAKEDDPNGKAKTKRKVPSPPPVPSLVCRPCDHTSEGVGDFVALKRSYFTESFFKKVEEDGDRFPISCQSCKKKFNGWKKKSELADDEIYVGDNSRCERPNVAWCCRNAEKADHDCNFALCSPCKAKYLLMNCGGNPSCHTRQVKKTRVESPKKPKKRARR